jgi:hypothetical protein
MEGWKDGRHQPTFHSSNLPKKGMARALQTGLWALLLLAACNVTFSPEQAVLQSVLDSPSDTQVNPATVRILQTKPWEGGQVAQVAFQEIDPGGQIYQCLYMYELQQSVLGWRTGGGGGGCGPVGGSGEAIGIGAGQHSGVERMALSHVDGLVYDPNVRTIEIIWDDGESQQVEVVNGAYLALRAGEHEYTEVRARNAAGEVVYTHEQPQLAPGKESRRPERILT